MNFTDKGALVISALAAHGAICEYRARISNQQPSIPELSSGSEAFQPLGKGRPVSSAASGMLALLIGNPRTGIRKLPPWAAKSGRIYQRSLICKIQLAMKTAVMLRALVVGRGHGLRPSRATSAASSFRPMFGPGRITRR